MVEVREYDSVLKAGIGLVRLSMDDCLKLTNLFTVKGIAGTPGFTMLYCCVMWMRKGLLCKRL